MYLEMMIHRYVMDILCKPNIYASLSTSELRVRLVPFKSFSDIYADRPKAVLLSWIFFVIYVSCLPLLCCLAY